MLIRIVRLVFSNDKVADFLKNFEEIKHKIRSFEGCSKLELLQDAENPNIYYTYSCWDTEEHLNQYRESAFFDQTWAFTKSLFADKPMAFSVHKVDSL